MQILIFHSAEYKVADYYRRLKCTEGSAERFKILTGYRSEK